MTEQDYIIVENLTKLRTVRSILGDMISGAGEPITEEEITELHKQVWRLMEKLNKVIKID